MGPVERYLANISDEHAAGGPHRHRIPRAEGARYPPRALDTNVPPTHTYRSADIEAQ